MHIQEHHDEHQLAKQSLSHLIACQVK